MTTEPDARTANLIGARGRKLIGFCLFAMVLLTALAFAGAGRAAIDSPAPPQIWSDKADYAPGETVTLSGANWAVGEAVHIRVNDDAGQTWSRDVDVTAADDGTISDQFALPTSFVAVYTVTATGAQSGAATWSFTDGNVKFDVGPIPNARATFVENIYTASTSCTGAVRTNGGFPDKTVTNGLGDTQGVGNTESLRIDASATTTNSPTLSFLAWSSIDSPASPFTVIASTNGLSVCIPGFGGNGTKNYRATYGNSAPVIARDTSPVVVNEGATASNTGTWSDANPAETVTLTASVGTVTKAGNNASGTWSWSFGTTDGPAQSQTVTITATDSTGLSTPTTFTLTVNNVAPSATFNAPASVNEGSNINLSLTSPSDPSSLDTGAGFTYAFDCGTGSGYGAFSATSTASCSTNDNGTRTVKGKIKDKDGDSSEYTASVTVNNVAPSATFNAPASVNEGSNINLSLTSPSDPSSVDTAAGFTYAFDCGSGYGAFSASNSTSCSTNDNGTRTVKGKIKDKDGDSSEYTAFVTTDNVAPTGTLGNNGPKDEGSAVSVSFTGVSDPSSVDATSLHYAFDCAGGSLAAVTYAGAGTSSSTSCTFNDNGSYSVTGVIIDKDGGRFNATTSVTVTNVAPTATLSNNGPVDEGSPATASFSGQSDPSSVDTAAGFHYAYSCTNGSLAGATYATAGTSASTSCTFNDNGSFTVRARIIDKDNGFNEYTSTVSVTNVAPTADFSNTGPVDEGSSFLLKMDNGDDVSSVDKAAKFTFAFDCGNGIGYGSFSVTPTLSAQASCSTNDNGTRSVKAKIKDKDGGVREYTGSVAVNNVPPSATFNAPAAVDEGSDINISLSDVVDPGTADTFEYRFKCGDGPWSAYGASASHACPTDDNGIVTVKGQVRDDDGGESDVYSADVTVNNVPPTVTLTGLASANEGDTNSYSYSWTDPGTADTFPALGNSIGCGVHGTASDVVFTPLSKTGSFKCTWSDDSGLGTADVSATVTDDDGGADTDTINVTVANVAPQVNLTGPSTADEGDTKIYNYTITDPGTDDTFSFVTGYPTCGLHGQLVGTPVIGDGSFQCTFPDGPNTTDVKIKVQDDDGGVSVADTEHVEIIQVAIANVAPTADLGNNGPVGEGSPATVSFTNQFDPSADDTTAGFHYEYNCDGSLFSSAADYATADTSASHQCTFPDGPSMHTVRARIIDRDSDATAYNTTVNVTNVAPMVTAPADDTASEGTAKTFSLGSFSDPGADSPWAVDVDWGDGTTPHTTFNETAVGAASSQTITAHPHTYDDNGVYTATVKVTDKDGGTNSKTFKVTVSNVAPTATFNAPASANEGSSFMLSLTDPQDPSGADTTAGFTYAFDCGSGYGAYSSSSSRSCPTTDNGVRAVKGKIKDKDGGYTEYTASVTVNNVLPAVVAADNQNSDEGENHSFSLGSFSDPGADSPWAVDVDWGDGTTPHTTFNETFAGAALNHAITAKSHKYDDNGTYTVTVKVTDKDGGYDSKTFQVSVANVAPTATFPATRTVDEGSSSSFAFTSPSDPSAADTTAGFHYAYHCDGSAFSPAPTYVGSGTGTSVSCAFGDGPDSQTVRARIIDKDSGFTEYTTAVTVANVAPSATFNSPASVNEGSSFTLSLTGPSDPSTADTGAGFTYAFDCGSGTYGAFGASNSTSCPTSDNGTLSVHGKIKDKDGGERPYTASVMVNNVAPSATFSNNGPVDESTSFTIQLTGPSDPSSADTTAGFTYAFDCGSGYGAYSSSSSRSCPTTDNGVRAVKGKIKDKDGDAREYTGSVTVNNVAPHITNVTASNTFAGPLVFMTSSIATYFTDPGSADTWVNLLTFSDGGTETGNSSNAAIFSSPSADNYKFTLTHSFATPGCKTVTSKVTDDDGGFDTSGATPVNVGTGEFQPPMTNTPVTNQLRNGQVLPVKIKLTDCNGAPITGLNPAIVLKKGDLTTVGDDTIVPITPTSVSNADTTGFMRSNGDGSYIYNMNVNISLNTDYTVIVYPWGTGTASQYFAHVIRATK